MSAKEYAKTAGVSVGVIIGSCLLVFALATGSFYMYKHFAPKYANVEREVYENTKSYVHGKNQDLARYYENYQKAEPDEKEAIRQIILMNFASVDASKISNQRLQNFLTQQRGY